ncbi:MAG: ABC transporter ATP-binding protein [Desulfobacterales bacterium]|nr:ABC transporter ATP-binding protein [Pseudomonadota bacterium]MCG2778973.1 ABC transporter ATP-binding protein [Desulfobacterales bacterium]
MADIILEMNSLSKRYESFFAVDHISSEVKKGEFLTLLGPSGSGKTTTLMMIAGFVEPTSGDILIEGSSIVSKPPHKRDVGMVFQNYALFPHLTVFENIAFPLKMRKTEKSEIEKRVNDVLELVRLPEVSGRYPKQLSGGQQQRIALARALVFNPPLLLMDEPLGALDKQLREHMQLEIKHIQEDLDITVIYVTHDQAEALTMSDTIAVMNHGKIMQYGSAEDLYERPANKFVAEFIGESNFLEGKIESIDGDSIYARTHGQLEIHAKQNQDVSLGQEVFFTLRPERITFINETGQMTNTFNGVIEEVVYVGEISKYMIRLSEEDDLFILKQQNQLGVKKYKKGDRVIIGWNPEDMRLI